MRVAIGLAAAVALAFGNPVASSAAPMTGTSGDDRLEGTPRADRIYGLGGADKLFGTGGSDKEYGGGGPDALHGGVGSDYLYPQAGRDRVYGDDGPDFIRANDGRRDVIRCGPGRDQAWVDRSDRRRGCEFVEVLPTGAAKGVVAPRG